MAQKPLQRLIDRIGVTGIIRAAGCFVLCITMITVALAQTRENPVEIEHRFTQLETKVDALVSDIQNIKYMGGLLLFGIAGLLGEAGMRIVRRTL